MWANACLRQYGNRITYMTTDDDGNLMVRVMLIKVMITDDSEDGDN